MDQPDPQPDVILEPRLDPVAALSQVQDDQADKLDACHWATIELINGQSLEDVHNMLIEQGWDEDSAQEIVEAARKQTRRERGVVTREDIVRGLDVEYRRATSGVSMFFFGGLMGRAARTFFAALRTAARLRRIARKK